VRNTVKYQHKALIDKLTNLRQERKLSQEKLALTIGVDTKLFGQWERKLVEPKLFNLLCWCEALP
jgi:DNA-binding XRE family transcriptional regulator